MASDVNMPRSLVHASSCSAAHSNGVDFFVKSHNLATFKEAPSKHFVKYWQLASIRCSSFLLRGLVMVWKALIFEREGRSPSTEQLYPRNCSDRTRIEVFCALSMTPCRINCFRSRSIDLINSACCCRGVHSVEGLHAARISSTYDRHLSWCDRSSRGTPSHSCHV